jgi:hypothetical protein
VSPKTAAGAVSGATAAPTMLIMNGPERYVRAHRNDHPGGSGVDDLAKRKPPESGCCQVDPLAVSLLKASRNYVTCVTDSRYLRSDRRRASEALAARTAHLKEKLVKLEEELAKLAAYEKQMLATPDQQISLTDSDSGSMASSGRGSGVVGHNVQVAVDTEHHLIVTHEVTNSGLDWAQLADIASQAKAVLVENSNVLIKLLQEVLDYKPRRGDNRPAPDLWLDDTA